VCAKEVLSVIPGAEVRATRTVNQAIEGEFMDSSHDTNSTAEDNHSHQNRLSKGFFRTNRGEQ
jgi:hypothetical protein